MRLTVFRVALVASAALVASHAIAADPPATESAAAGKVDPSGTWTWDRELNGQSMHMVLKLSLKDGKLTGTYKRGDQELPVNNGKLEKDEISFDTAGTLGERKFKGKFKGKVSKDAIKGNIELSSDEGSLPPLDWEAKRSSDVGGLAGEWKLKITTPDGNSFEPTLKLTGEGDKLKGKYTSRFGENEAQDIKSKNGELTWMISGERDGNKYKVVYKGKVDGDSIKGTADFDISGNNGTLDFTGQRVSAKKDGDKKDAPKKEESKDAKDKTSSTNVPERRVIVSLKSRHETHVVYSTRHDGPAFSVLSADGTVLAKELSVEALKTGYPQFFDLYRTAYANVWAGE